MKKNIVYNLFALLMLVVVSCRKTDNPRIPDLERVPVPYIKADATKSQSISVLNPTSFNQTFTFTPYFTNDIPPKQIDLVVIKNGVNASVKTVQAGFTTFPATANVTGAQLISLFGAIKLGDTYTFGLDITTQNGTVYHAFPALGVGYGSGVLNEYNGANSNVTPLANGGGVVYQLAFGALCTYDPSIYKGNFVVVKDDFGELNPGDILTLTQISNTSFSFIYVHPAMLNPLPVIVNINPNNNVASITKQKVGTSFYGFTGPNFETVPGNNFVAPCDQTLTLDIKYTVDLGSFGNAPLVLKKQ